jgi:hypothetical protein
MAILSRYQRSAEMIEWILFISVMFASKLVFERGLLHRFSISFIDLVAGTLV